LRRMLSVVLSLTVSLHAFAAAPRALSPAPPAVRHHGPLIATVCRRDVAVGTAAVVASLLTQPQLVHAADNIKTVVVAGASGQTGRRCLQRLAGIGGGVTAIGGVRDPSRAAKKLAEGKLNLGNSLLKSLDVEKQSVGELAATLKGTDALLIAVGFIPGNPFQMDASAHAVDNVGTVKLVDAAKAAGVRKVVLVSSILTDGGAWGQLKSPGYQITNAFGHVLEEKLVAEKYLRASGLDWTIVRPGGLKAEPATGALFVSGENTLNSGEISRDLVAEVSVAALFDTKASNQVVEIVESDKDGNAKTGIFNGLKM